MKIGIIGGTGLDDPNIIQQRKEIEFKYELPWKAKSCAIPDYGVPSDKLITGYIGDIECAIIPRHGRDHSINPSNVNYRANLLALYQFGCDVVIATHSMGSLKEEFKPGDFVILEQIIDRTHKRHLTYFDNAESSWPGVIHVSFGEPYDANLNSILEEVGNEMPFKVHTSGTCVAVEGPRFSTRAESKMFQAWGADTIGMTQVPEAQLAKELHLPFCAIGMVTDYDAWRPNKEPVTVDDIKLLVSGSKTKMIEYLLVLLKRIEVKYEVNKNLRNHAPGTGYFC